jgi:hypothetical protein
LAGIKAGAKSTALSGVIDSKKQDEATTHLLSSNESTTQAASEDLVIRVLGELRRLRNADVHLPPGATDDE